MRVLSTFSQSASRMPLTGGASPPVTDNARIRHCRKDVDGHRRMDVLWRGTAPEPVANGMHLSNIHYLKVSSTNITTIMCAPQSLRPYAPPTLPSPRAKRPLSSITDAMQAASLATASLRRHFPCEIASYIISFVAGTHGWHLDDACAYGFVSLALCVHTVDDWTPATVCTSHAMDRAASAGHLPLIRWLHANRHEGCSPAAFNDAAKHGHVHVLEWLLAYKAPGMQLKGLENGVLYNAVENGHTAVIQWLYTARPTLVPFYSVMNQACRCGHLSVVELLHRLSAQNPLLAKATPHAMDTAADHGYLDIVKWLHNHRQEGCTTNAMDYAAGRGHLDILQWLHANRTEGCTRKALLNAATHGHMEIVQWLLDAHVVPLDATVLSEAMEFAAYYDHKDLWTLLRNVSKPKEVTLSIPNDLYVATQIQMAV